MFDLVGKADGNEVLLALVSGLAHTLKICLQKLNFLGEVGLLLVKLLIAMDLCKEGPVIEAIDSIFEDGIGGSVTPELTTETVGEWLHWLVSGVVWGGIQFNDLGILLSLSSGMESCNPSIVRLLDEAGELLCAIIQRDGEVGESFFVLLIPCWTLCKVIVFAVHPLLKYCKFGLELFNLLLMDIVSNLDGVSKS